MDKSAQNAPVLTATESREILRQLGEIQQRLNDALAVLPKLDPDAKRAVEARMNARARGFFIVPEFAAVIGRHNQYVSDRCAAKAIRVLPGGKPFRIPLSEEAVWNNPDDSN